MRRERRVTLRDYRLLRADPHCDKHTAERLDSDSGGTLTSYIWKQSPTTETTPPNRLLLKSECYLSVNIFNVYWTLELQIGRLIGPINNIFAVTGTG